MSSSRNLKDRAQSQAATMEDNEPTVRHAKDESFVHDGHGHDDDDDDGDGRESHRHSSLNASTNHSSKSSLVQYYGPNNSSCGYCKHSGKGRRTYDMHTYTLTPSDYQILLDRNWRRSGNYSYYPINQTTCCPNYSLSCAATKFQLSRSQRKCVKRVNSFLANADIKSNPPIDYSKGPADEIIIKKKKETLDTIKSSSKLRHVRFLRASTRKAKLDNSTLEEAMNAIRDKWNNKLQPRLPLESYLFPKRATLSDSQESFKPKHSLNIEMIYVDSARCRSIREEQQRMIVKYQAAVHKENGDDWTMSRFSDFLVHSPLIQEPLANFDYLDTEPTDGEDTSSVDVNSSNSSEFILVKPPHLPTTFGTYHCNYYLDDRLIATGVLDVLPKCITTVYFFYDPQFAFLNLGTYSALVEISMVRQMNKHYVASNSSDTNQLVNYYLGFYVHECTKMHYKTKFRPAYLLCSKTLRYVPVEECLNKLKDKKYADFAIRDEHDDASSPPVLHVLLTIPIEPPVDSNEVNSRMISYIMWLEKNLGVEHVDLLMSGYLMMYAKLIGHKLIDKMVLKMNVVHITLVERHKRLTRNRGATCDTRH